MISAPIFRDMAQSRQEVPYILAHTTWQKIKALYYIWTVNMKVSEGKKKSQLSFALALHKEPSVIKPILSDLVLGGIQ